MMDFHGHHRRNEVCMYIGVAATYLVSVELLAIYLLSRQLVQQSDSTTVRIYIFAITDATHSSRT